MTVSRYTQALLFCLVALTLGACKQAAGPTSTPEKPKTVSASASAATFAPIEFAGVNLRTANRRTLEEAFAKEYQLTFIPRNEWESVAEKASSMLPGADKVELATTKSGQFVFLQFIFPDAPTGQQRAQVQQLVQAKYGPPAGVDGRADRGEYRAIWDMGGGFLIQVSSGGAEKATFLIFAASENLVQMKSEHQEMLNQRGQKK